MTKASLLLFLSLCGAPCVRREAIKPLTFCHQVCADFIGRCVQKYPHQKRNCRMIAMHGCRMLGIRWCDTTL